ncbi:MAG: hypothetical protein ACREJU_06010 [Nitrospiraceae bacterium]
MDSASAQKIYGKGERMERGLQQERQVPEWETKLGKMIFYITAATAIWFFYWFNGIQCPC